MQDKIKSLMKPIIAIVIVFALGLGIVSSVILQKGMVAKPNFTELKEFKNINKEKASVFIVTSPSCSWCKKLKSDFITEQYIEKYPNIEFVEIVEGTPVYYALNHFAKIEAYPTIVMLRRDGQGLNFINQTTGYVKPEGLNKAFSFINDGKDIVEMKKLQEMKKAQDELKSKVESMQKEVNEQYERVKAMEKKEESN